MSVTAIRFPMGSSERFFGRALVVEPAAGDEGLRLGLAGEHGQREVRAVSALPEQRSLRPGESVLVAEGEESEFFVVGVLGSAPNPGERLVTPAGAVAEIGPDAETIRVRSPAGELVFEYHPAERRTRVRVPDGDLEIAAPHGNIELRSGKEVRVHGDRSATVSGGEWAEVCAGSPDRAVCTGLELSPSQMSLRSPVLRVHGERAEAMVGDASVRGETLSMRWTTAKVIAERVESWSREVVTRAREVHQTVERLWQVKAERVRTVARAACQFQGRKVLLRAEEDVKVRGDRIELG